MRKYLSAALAAVFMAWFASPALAADIILPVSCTPDNKVCTGSFSVSPVTDANFTQGFTFDLPLDGKFGGSVTTEFTAAISDIDFISILIDGVHAFTKDASIVEPQERWSIANLVLTGGPHRIDIIGTSAGLGSYAGTISFAAVPEPATWAMMILGFGLVGGALRRRRSVSVRYA